jgi:TRAP-type C4-dicarboxylate transport system substrate-binding protein
MPNWPRGLALALAFTVAMFGMAASASAQTKLKWAHVYEVSEPYHTQAL